MIGRDPQNVYPGSCYDCGAEVPDDEDLDENQRCAVCATAWIEACLEDEKRFG